MPEQGRPFVVGGAGEPRRSPPLEVGSRPRRVASVVKPTGCQGPAAAPDRRRAPGLRGAAGRRAVGPGARPISGSRSPAAAGQSSAAGGGRGRATRYDPATLHGRGTGGVAVGSESARLLARPHGAVGEPGRRRSPLMRSWRSASRAATQSPFEPSRRLAESEAGSAQHGGNVRRRWIHTGGVAGLRR